METLRVIGENLGVISGIIVAAGIILTAIVKGYKFVKKVNTKLEYIDKLEEANILEYAKEIETIKGNQETMKETIGKLDESIRKLSDTMDKIASQLNQLCEDFNKHAEIGERTTDLLIDQARFTLETAMKKAITQGAVDVDERKLIGSLFASYEKNHGNFGIKDIFDIYKELPVKEIK